MLKMVHSGQLKALRARYDVSCTFSMLHLYMLAQDYDDDGEDAAGGRLLHLLQILDVKNTVVVVSRWYGGVKLGPARFTHINNAARLLLEKCGCLQSEKMTASTTKRKGRRH